MPGSLRLIDEDWAATLRPSPGSNPIMRLPWWVPFGAVPEIEPTALAAALARPAEPQLLDVRTSGEFARGHIRDAVNAPITLLRARIPSLGLDAARPVVAICLSAHRSLAAVRLLRLHGFDAAHLAGGMLAWRAAGLPEVGR